MQVTTKANPPAWAGGSITIGFDTREEAEVFFSLFNTGRVADALRSVAFKASRIYDQAGALGVSDNKHVRAIDNYLKSRS